MAEVRIGAWSVTGPVAGLLALALLAGLVALVVASHPSPGMLAAGGVWLGYIVYWNRTAKRDGLWEAAESAHSRAVHQNLLNLGLLLLFVPVPGLRASALPAAPWRVPAGLGVMAAATALHAWARHHLGRNWSSAVMLERQHALVRTGPYALVRHPVYTALVGLALGTAVVAGRWTSLLGAAVFALAYLRKLRLEERALAGRFGAEWEAYRERSWALVPGLL